MRALNMIVATPDAERFRGAILLAAAQAALGGAATLFLQLDAVALLRPPITAPRDEAHGASGLPSLAMLLADATALGVRIIAWRYAGCPQTICRMGFWPGGRSACFSRRGQRINCCSSDPSANHGK